MTNRPKEGTQAHGPENAEHEIRKAYNCVIESGLILSPKHLLPADSEHWKSEVVSLYKHAYDCYRKGSKLAAERWARTAKHLARAFSHEAKIAYLEPRATDLPFLAGSGDGDYQLTVRPDTTADLLDSLERHIPPEQEGSPKEMRRYLKQGRKHLEILNRSSYRHELLRAERIKAAYEYGRVIECMELAHEVDRTFPAVAA